ncbi:uncharacterized protein LOC111406849 [Olea europaea var. sylvestris]|uniref:uncharacterized protein LOC111406849 n=1 Tax=Olea europaea var. sylvestris TaxID=158386 RepID=UPI000C1D5553|nr:uncharacterized protein LOC111406849 [Olea europaea var. sylvestris]
MDYSPFLTNHWSPQQPLSRKYARSPSVRGIPVHTAEPSRPAHPIQPPPVKTSSQKVVQIPVHFVGSESTRWASALKIQKVFRGFLVRKSVKKIKGVKFQVDEIEERLLKSEVVNLIERDEKERLKMNESLMALLFKLDSVRGIELGVRDLRKVVIRKAIALQEKIDAIVSVNSENASEINDVDEPSEATDQAIEIDSEKLGNGNSDNFYVLTEHSPTLYDSAENNSENLGNISQFGLGETHRSSPSNSIILISQFGLGETHRSSPSNSIILVSLLSWDDGLYDREEKDERRFNYLLSIVMIESLKVTNCNIRFHSSSFLELCSGFLLLIGNGRQLQVLVVVTGDDGGLGKEMNSS